MDCLTFQLDQGSTGVIEFHKGCRKGVEKNPESVVYKDFFMNNETYCSLPFLTLNDIYIDAPPLEG